LQIGKSGHRAFVVRGGTRKIRYRDTLGAVGAVLPTGVVLSLPVARVKAKEILGVIASGVNPSGPPKRTADTLTVADALAGHLADMRKRDCSARSLQTIETGVNKYFARWLKTPIVEVTATELRTMHEAMTAAGKTHLPNRLLREFSAIWNTADREHEFAVKNPASRVRKNQVEPNGDRLSDAELPAWYQKVLALAPTRSLFHLLVLHTGLRSADARSIRWDEIDFSAATLFRPSPKGGKKKAFTLPLPTVIVPMLISQRDLNAREFAADGGDGGWVFASRSSAQPRRVQPMSQPKEREGTGKRGHFQQTLPGPHVLRRTYISIGQEIGINADDLHLLANHKHSRGSIQSSHYIRQSLAHLAGCQAKIAAAIAAKVGMP
jgi:integrase